MHLLQGQEKLGVLERKLLESFPESLKVYGTVFHINRGNPFNLEVLVDSWPDFKTVITRPQLDEMSDDLDYYTNTYFIFTRDPVNLREVLEKSDAINWCQTLQIQGLQDAIGEVLADISDTKSFRFKTTRTVLYVKEPDRPDASKMAAENPLVHGQDDATTRGAPATQKRSSGDQPSSSLSSLQVHHAELVNASWAFGGNERSLRYVQRCIEHLPSSCIIGPDGGPISWSVMEQSCEIRMGYTLPDFRCAGLSKQLLKSFLDSLQKRNFPFYAHVAHENTKAKGVPLGAGLKAAPCSWYQWNCSPALSQKL